MRSQYGCFQPPASRSRSSYLVDVFAFELFEELGETVFISVDADRGQDTLDIGLGGVGVAGKAEEEVGCEVLHVD